MGGVWRGLKGQKDWVLAKMDSSLNAMEHIQIYRFPTVILFPGKDKNNWFSYDGEFNTKKISEWAQKLIDSHEVKYEL